MEQRETREQEILQILRSVVQLFKFLQLIKNEMEIKAWIKVLKSKMNWWIKIISVVKGDEFLKLKLRKICKKIQYFKESLVE